MKTKVNFMKKSLFVSAIMMILFLSQQMAWGQTGYKLVFWDNYPAYQDIQCCSPTDSIKCIPPAGVTVTGWTPSLTTHGDTLVLAAGFNGQVNCFFNGGQKSLRLRPTTIPTSPLFPTSDTVCGQGTLTLDLQNYSQYGFTDYAWWKNSSLYPATTQTILVGEGTWIGQATNECGIVADTIHILEYNPHAPLLTGGTICLYDSLLLDAGIHDTYSWNGPGVSMSSTQTVFAKIQGTYWITTNDAGCIDTASTYVAVNTPYTGQRICYVSKGISSNLNEISFTETPNHNTAFYNIKKESSISGVFTPIEQLAATGTTAPKIVTDSSDNGTIQFTYTITITDSCGNESPYLGIVKPTFLSISKDINDQYNLDWLLYIDANYVVQTNYIYSGNTYPLSLRDSVSGTVDHYLVPITNTDSIFGVGVQRQCPVAKSNGDIALSNRVKKSEALNVNELPIEQLIHIFPNPVSSILSINTSLEIEHIVITDIIGGHITSTSEKYIDFSALAKGLYFVTITTHDQKMMVTKIIKF